MTVINERHLRVTILLNVLTISYLLIDLCAKQTLMKLNTYAIYSFLSMIC